MVLRLSVSEAGEGCSQPACVLAGRSGAGPETPLRLGANVLLRPANVSLWGDGGAPVFDVACSAGCAAQPGALQLSLKDCRPGGSGGHAYAGLLGVAASVEYVDVSVHTVAQGASLGRSRRRAESHDGFAAGTLGVSVLTLSVGIVHSVAKRILRKAYRAAAH